MDPGPEPIKGISSKIKNSKSDIVCVMKGRNNELWLESSWLSFSCSNNNMIWICTYLEHKKYILNFLFVFVAEAQALVLIMAEEIKCHSVSRGELPIYITTMENCTRHDTGITLSYWEEENKDNMKRWKLYLDFRWRYLREKTALTLRVVVCM